MRKTSTTTPTETEKCFDAESRKLNDLREKLADAEAKLALADGLRDTRGTVASKALALLDGEPSDDEFLLEQVQREAVVLGEACKIQERRVLDAQRQVGIERYESCRAGHDALVCRIVVAFEALHDAIADELAFRNSFAKWLPATAFRSPAFGSTPWLANVRRVHRGALRDAQIARGFNVQRKG